MRTLLMAVAVCVWAAACDATVTNVYWQNIGAQTLAAANLTVTERAELGDVCGTIANTNEIVVRNAGGSNWKAWGSFTNLEINSNNYVWVEGIGILDFADWGMGPDIYTQGSIPGVWGGSGIGKMPGNIYVSYKSGATNLLIHNAEINGQYVKAGSIDAAAINPADWAAATNPPDLSQVVTNRGGAVLGDVTGITGVTNVGALWVTDLTGNSWSNAWGLFGGIGDTNTQGFRMEDFGGPPWHLAPLDPLGDEYYYGTTIPGNWAGSGFRCIGTVHVEYACAVSNLVLHNGQLDGSFLASKSVAMRALAITPLTNAAEFDAAGAAATVQTNAVDPTARAGVYSNATTIANGLTNAVDPTARAAASNAQATANAATPTQAVVTLIGSATGTLDAAISARGYASTNPAHVWQGAAVVALETNRYTLTLGGDAVQVGSIYWLLTNSANWRGATGTLTVATTDGSYLVDVQSGNNIAVNMSQNVGVTISGFIPGGERRNSTQIVFTAWCQDGGVGPYYAAMSNIVPRTYDRPGMTPQMYTNDAPGQVARVDDSTADDQRAVVNQKTMAANLAAQAPAISAAGWNYTPSGATRANRGVVEIDQPILHQGSTTRIQAGDDYCLSAHGGDYLEVTTGSVWRIGPSGLTSFEISSTNHMLNVSRFVIVTNQIQMTISTNLTILGTPAVQGIYTNLANRLWMPAAGVTLTNRTTNWLATFTKPAGTYGFYRAVSVGGDNRVTSYVKHFFPGGMNFAGCPTSGAGLVAGDLWSSNGVMMIAP